MTLVEKVEIRGVRGPKAEIEDWRALNKYGDTPHNPQPNSTRTRWTNLGSGHIMERGLITETRYFLY